MSEKTSEEWIAIAESLAQTLPKRQNKKNDNYKKPNRFELLDFDD